MGKKAKVGENVHSTINPYHSMGKFSSGQTDDGFFLFFFYFVFFPQANSFDIYCKLSPSPIFLEKYEKHFKMTSTEIINQHAKC